MNIPSDWERVKIGALTSVSRGASPRPIASPRWFDTQSKIRWVRISDVNRSNGRILRETIQALSTDGVSRSRYLKPGTLIMSIAATVGIPVITGIPTCIHDGFVALENLKVDQRFLLYLLKVSEPRLRENGQSGSQMNINSDIVRDLDVLIPSDRGEQERIATALWDVDELIVSLEHAVAKKRAIKQGMMQELMTGRTRLSGYTGLWRRVLFSDIVTPVSERVDPGRAIGRVVELEHLSQSTGELVGYSDVRSTESLKTSFHSGDVLFGKLRAYLRKFWLADFDGFCSTEIWALRPIPKVSDGAFIRYVVEEDAFIEAASTSYGTHMPRSDWRVVSKFELDLPPLDEQRAIAQVLRVADAEIEALEKRLEATRQIKEGMMQELLTGRTRLV